jgi:hypothetical protein
VGRGARARFERVGAGLAAGIAPGLLGGLRRHPPGERAAQCQSCLLGPERGRTDRGQCTAGAGSIAAVATGGESGFRHTHPSLLQSRNTLVEHPVYTLACSTPKHRIFTASPPPRRSETPINALAVLIGQEVTALYGGSVCWTSNRKVYASIPNLKNLLQFIKAAL